MKISVFILLILSTLSSCSEEKKQMPSEPETTVDSIVSEEMHIAAISECMDAQEAAWNNGDPDGFMSCYWNSDSLLFIGKSGLNRGWMTTLENYRKSYPDKEAMGRLEFNNLEYKAIEQKHFLVIGKWTLYRTEDTLGGHYSLIWQKRGNQWMIIADHSS